MRYLKFVVAILLGISAIPAFCASNYLGGMSGNLYTPDEVVVPTGTWDVSFHDTLNASRKGVDLNATGVQYGLFKKLEVGASILSDGSTKVALNGKYGLVPETATIPNVSIGVFDAAAQFGSSPTVYILASKDITPTATSLAGHPSKPLRLTLGAGTGIVRSFFASLNWAFAPKTQLLFDYTTGTIEDRDNVTSAGIRYALTNNIRLDAAFFDFRELALGASARSSFK